MEIGSKLRAARQRTGFTQEQVGEAIHVSRQTISNWETGKSLPDVLSVISLSDLYQVSLDELLKGDEKMLRHIDESTNMVKSRQRLGKLVQTLSFLVIWAVCVAVFWLGGGSDAMGFSILVLYGVLPLSTFVVSLLMGLDASWKERQWGMLLYFGVGFMLMPYGTFSLANMLSTGNIRLPEWEYIAYGMVYAMQGMCLGSVIRWGRAPQSQPQRPSPPFVDLWPGVGNYRCGTVQRPLSGVDGSVCAAGSSHRGGGDRRIPSGDGGAVVLCPLPAGGGGSPCCWRFLGGFSLLAGKTRFRSGEVAPAAIVWRGVSPQRGLGRLDGSPALGQEPVARKQLSVGDAPTGFGNCCWQFLQEKANFMIHNSPVDKWGTSCYNLSLNK